MSDKDNYYIATSIPYVNDVPHLGHAMEFILGDVISRYQIQLGKDVFFSAGTDEHGGKVMEKAAENNKTPEQYADEISQSFKDLAKTLDVEITKFIRTTDPDHEKRAALIWEKMSDDIYQDSYKGMYDQREESFITSEEAQQIKKTDPKRYDRLEELEEKNYFFKLSKYTKPIKEAIENEDLKIVPISRRNEILSLLDQGLEDISISRPTEKIPWGIPVPNDDSQTIYVWLEALMNYITTLEYPEGSNFKKFWPADVHVIGKDITRFHAAIWPALLLSIGEKMPKSIYVHGFINVNGEKMSKSVGNVVAPLDIVSAYGSDAFRYYFTRHIPSYDDGDFSWEKFEASYNNELGNELGNLVQRTAKMIESYQKGEVGELPQSMHDIEPFHEMMAEYKFDRALDYIWTLVRGLNQYIDEESPWQLAKDGDGEHLKEVLAYVTASLLQVADLVEPFMPKSSESIIKTFGTGKIKLPEKSLFPRVLKFSE